MHNENGWIDRVRAKGLSGPLHVALDVLEPLGPLGAQLIWFAQPAFMLFGRPAWRAAAVELAQALEEPGGIERLRECLNDPGAPE
jgi:hypothetical protein